VGNLARAQELRHLLLDSLPLVHLLNKYNAQPMHRCGKHGTATAQPSTPQNLKLRVSGAALALC
jgi:hypothetical protein